MEATIAVIFPDLWRYLDAVLDEYDAARSALPWWRRILPDRGREEILVLEGSPRVILEELGRTVHAPTLRSGQGIVFTAAQCRRMRDRLIEAIREDIVNQEYPIPFDGGT